ncbi:MAG: response regulator [Limisphaerales bacterium]|jgi:two-component system sensor histidine kinase/response regulator|nr:response regulator [Verrucomicrobiota bacterium]
MDGKQSQEPGASSQQFRDQRLKALDRYDVHEGEYEEDFEGLLQVAAALFNVPIASLNFLNGDQVTYFAFSQKTERHFSQKETLCEQILQEDESILVINDLQQHPHLSHPPAFFQKEHIRFCAAVPLLTFDDLQIGTLQVMDTKPHDFSADDRTMLKTLARQIMNRLDLTYRFYQMRKASALYQSLVEHLPNSLCILRKNLEGEFTFVNKNFCKHLGKEYEEVIRKTDFDFFPEELAKKYRHDDEKVVSSKTSLTLYEVNKSPQGDKRHVHVVKIPLFDPDNPYEVVGIQCIFWDETSRVEAQQQMQFQKNLLDQLMDMSADSIYFKDLDSRFMRVSRSMLRYFGVREEEEMLGKRDSDFFLSRHADKALKDEQEIISTGKPLISKVEKETWADGHETYALTNKAPLHDENGNIIGTLGVSKDITRLIQTEAALKKARDQALEATRVKSQFLANMTHEIRTPMNVVIGMAEQMGMTPLEPQQREFLSYISSSANSLLSIIQDILDFSKMEAGKLSIPSIDCNLHQTILQAVSPLATLAEQQGIELLLLLDDQLPEWVCSAPERIRQILTNLIANAIKFTLEGEVVLTVSVLKKTAHQTEVEFTIRDTGIGIPNQVIPKLFTAFSQADGSTTRQFGGTGLGLAICKQLATLMKGSISVESTQGKGSIFKVILPLRRPLKPREESPSSPLEADFFTNRPVLIVDDNATSRQILRIYLESQGAEITEATNAADALEALRDSLKEKKTPFAFALLDYQMPEMDGIALAEKIRALNLQHKMKLILLSGVSSVRSPQALRESGFAGALLKPIQKRRLLECLHEVAIEDSAAKLFSQPDSPVQMEELPSMEEVYDRLKGENILIVEDMELNQKILLMQLEQLKLTADVVHNGKQALKAFKSKDYQLIFMDCQMPGMDGYEASQQIRLIEAAADYSKKPVFITAMTANAEEDDVAKCFQAGINYYLSKPLRLEDVEKFFRYYATRQSATPTQWARPVRAPDAEETPVALETEIEADEKTKEPKTSIKFSDEEFDTTTLETLRSLRRPGRPDPVAEAIKLFNQDATKSERALRKAIVAQDLANIRLYAHSIKGICTNLGARKAGNLYMHIEKSARDQKKVDYSTLLTEATVELERVKKFLESL